MEMSKDGDGQGVSGDRGKEAEIKRAALDVLSQTCR